MNSWIMERLVALERRVAELEKRDSKDEPKGRAMRLPADWTPRPEDLAWAKEKYPDVDEGTERDRFADYWRSRGETRRDWNAAYRNWIRKAADLAPPRQSGVPARSGSRTAGLAETNRLKRDGFADKLAALRRDRS